MTQRACSKQTVGFTLFLASRTRRHVTDKDIERIAGEYPTCHMQDIAGRLTLQFAGGNADMLLSYQPERRRLV